LAATGSLIPGDSPGRWGTVILLTLVIVPGALTATALLPELLIPIPRLNDDAFHFLLIQRASDALASGENPFDHWGPALDLGFPWFSSTISTCRTSR